MVVMGIHRISIIYLYIRSTTHAVKLVVGCFIIMTAFWQCSIIDNTVFHVNSTLIAEMLLVSLKIKHALTFMR